jgi:hypothetical protein
LKVNLRFRGTYRRHLQDRRISRARNQTRHLLPHWFLTRIILRPWRWKRYIPPKRKFTFNGLNSLICQKIVLFITTIVRTSNPTFPKVIQVQLKCKECDCGHLKINCFYNTYMRSRDSVVGIATGYGLDDWGVGVPVPVESRIFSSPRPRSTQPPIQWVPRRMVGWWVINWKRI